MIRALAEADEELLARFFDAVPAGDRTYFKEDVGQPGLARRWAAESRALRAVVVDDAGILAFAALVPGVGHTAHVADLRLIVAGHARGQGLGTAMARHMLLEAIRAGFAKLTVEVAAESEGAIALFRDLGFQPEALLRDQLRDADGAHHDLLILGHVVGEAVAGPDN